MTQISKRLFMAMLFALFASQASAMFISPDPLAPTEPGVGTNRYAYSHGDPINLSDPAGLATVANDDGTFSHYSAASREHAELTSGNPLSSDLRSQMATHAQTRQSVLDVIGGQHHFSYGTLGLGGSLTVALDDSVGLPNDPIHQGIKNRVITDIAFSLAVGLAASYSNPNSHGRRTVAVLGGIGTRQSGFVVAVSGVNALDPSQRGYLNSEERALGNSPSALAGFGIFDASNISNHHAEHKTLTYSYQNNINPVAMIASRPFCGSCESRIRASGGIVGQVVRTGPITGFQGATWW